MDLIMSDVEPSDVTASDGLRVWTKVVWAFWRPCSKVACIRVEDHGSVQNAHVVWTESVHRWSRSGHTIRGMACGVVDDWGKVSNLARHRVHHTGRSCEDWCSLFIPTRHCSTVTIKVCRERIWSRLVVDVQAVLGYRRRHIEHISFNKHICTWVVLVEQKIAPWVCRRVSIIPSHPAVSFYWVISWLYDDIYRKRI